MTRTILEAIQDGARVPYVAPVSGVETVATWTQFGGADSFQAREFDGDTWGIERRASTWAPFRRDFLESPISSLTIAGSDADYPCDISKTPFENLRRAYQGDPNKAAWVGLTLEECREVLETGGCERLTRPVMQALAQLRAETHAPRIDRAQVGAWDIPAVISGQPMPALSRVRGPAPVRAVDVQVSIISKTDPAALRAMAAQVAKASHDYTLTRGALTMAVHWVNGTLSPGYVRAMRKAGYQMKGITAMVEKSRYAPAAWRARLYAPGAPWAPQWHSNATAAVNAHLTHNAVSFDPCNVQEVAACLSPEIFRMYVVGQCPWGHTRNRDRVPESLAWPDRGRATPYRVRLDADNKAATAASMCAALADC